MNENGLNQGLLDRLVDFKEHKRQLKDVSSNACFYRKHEGKTVKNIENLNYYIDVQDRIGAGTFNKVDKICVLDPKERDNGDRTCIGKNLIMKRAHSDDHEPDESCVNGRYSLLFSKIAERNILPHFPLTIDVLMCQETNQPIVLQELADKDFKAFTNDKNVPESEIIKVLIQTMITYFYIGYVLKISTYDAKPVNVLVKNVGPSRISYFSENQESLTISFNYLALISDFDLTQRNDRNRGRNYILIHYYKYALNVLGIHEETKEYKLLLRDLKIGNFNEIIKISTQKRLNSEKIILLRKLYQEIMIYPNDPDELIQWKLSNFDMVCFYFVNCLSHQHHDHVVNRFLHLFLTDFILNRVDFFTVLNKHFHLYLDAPNLKSAHYHLDLMPRFLIQYSDNLKLSQCATRSSFFLDKYIDQEVGFNLKTPENIPQSSLIQYVKEKHPIASPYLNPVIRDLTFRELIGIGHQLKYTNGQVLDALQLFDFCLNKFDDIKNDQIRLWGLACLQMVYYKDRVSDLTRRMPGLTSKQLYDHISYIESRLTL